MGSPRKIVVWLFGRGCSVSCGLPWKVKWWYQAMPRACRVKLIKKAIRKEITRVPVGVGPYKVMLDLFLTHTDPRYCHALLTTNWDFLLQREISSFCQSAKPKWLYDSHVFHLNGSAEQWGVRSEMLLETDPPSARKGSHEANKAYNIMLNQKLFIVIGMSFKCPTDKSFLNQLQKHEDFFPAGDATWLVVNNSQSDLLVTGRALTQRFPGCKTVLVCDTFDDWIKKKCPELFREGVFKANLPVWTYSPAS